MLMPELRVDHVPQGLLDVLDQLRVGLRRGRCGGDDLVQVGRCPARAVRTMSVGTVLAMHVTCMVVTCIVMTCMVVTGVVVLCVGRADRAVNRVGHWSAPSC